MTDDSRDTGAPVLFVFSGLPGAGKSTLARMLAGRIGAVFLRIDTVEQEMREFGTVPVADEGYRVCYRLAADNLRVGNHVVADSCNPIGITRDAWHGVARDTGVTALNIEVVCSDETEHRRRVETRDATVPGLALPDWAAVQAREYEPWPDGDGDRVRIDTAGTTPDASFRQLLAALPLLPGTGGSP